MLSSGATSLWEVRDGAEAFSGAGSLCHAWSSVCNYVAGAHILGIRPLSPGFERFAVAPVTGGLTRASGVVPTVQGPIHVSWQDTGQRFKLKLRHPKSARPELKLPGHRQIESSVAAI